MFSKEITEDNELLLYLNGKLIYKRWLNTGQSKVFDVMAYDKYTYASYTDIDIESSNKFIEVNAQFLLIPTDEGGRTTGIVSGYRPNHIFEYNRDGKMVEAYMGDIQFDQPEILEPGGEYNVKVRFLLSQRLEKYLEPGREWFIHEGPNKIGKAKVIGFELPER